VRQVFLQLAMSRDGFIEGEDGDISFLDGEVDLSPFTFEGFLSGIDTLLMGRGSYERALELGPWYWGEDYDTYVFSKSGVDISTPRTFVTDEEPKALLARLRTQPGNDFWLFGGAKLNQSFLDEGLIDRAQVFTAPVDLGKGMGLFSSSPWTALGLRKARQMDNGWAEWVWPGVVGAQADE
jgi:dihydrofolate reductase